MTKLEKMLKYVSEHNDFYKKRIKEYGIKDPLDITQWPILTRKELQENRYNMFSDGFRDKYFNRQLHWQSSSGSSGVPINVYWDYKDWYASNMTLWRKRLQWYGIKPSDKYVIFTLNAYGVESDDMPIYYINEPKNVLSVNVSLIKNESGYDELVDIICQFNPRWLYIQPFILNKVISAFKRKKIESLNSLIYIESVGEILPSDLRKRATNFFNVPIANMYGSEEMNGIAYESPNHHMHVLNENVFVEILNKNANGDCGEGEAIITNLNNVAMPLIRYNQQDFILMCESDKNDERYIQNIIGRKHNHVEINGISVNSFMLSEVISEVNNEFGDPINEYEFIFSKNNSHLCCNIVVAPHYMNWIPSIIRRIKSVFICKLGEYNDVLLDINVISSISTTEKKHPIIKVI